MLRIDYIPQFIKLISKIKNSDEQLRIKRQIKKIIENPEIGKPMRYARKGTRKVYLGSFRLSYAYLPEEYKIVFLAIYHKDNQ